MFSLRLPLKIKRALLILKDPPSPHDLSHCSHLSLGLVSNNLLYLTCIYPLSEMVSYQGFIPLFVVVCAKAEPVSNAVIHDTAAAMRSFFVKVDSFNCPTKVKNTLIMKAEFTLLNC